MSSYTPEVNGVLIAYASVYGHTENAANILAAKLSDRGVCVKMYDTSVTAPSFILSDAFKYSHLVFAATTYNAGVFSTMEQLLHEIVQHNLQNRKVALIENGSWAPTSGGIMRNMLSELKGTEFIGDTLTIKSALAEGQLADLDALADAIAADVLPPKPEPVTVNVQPTDDGIFEVDNAAFNKFSYGCEVLTTRVDGKDYGCIINTAGQITSSDPKKITISCIKANHTCDMVAAAGIFNLSILSEDVPYDTFKHFGFQSGRDVTSSPTGRTSCAPRTACATSASTSTPCSAPASLIRATAARRCSTSPRLSRPTCSATCPAAPTATTTPTSSPRSSPPPPP